MTQCPHCTSQNCDENAPPVEIGNLNPGYMVPEFVTRYYFCKNCQTEFTEKTQSNPGERSIFG